MKTTVHTTSDEIFENLYIIGDVHGCYKTLMALISKLPENATIVFCGDLIDRGTQSKEVIEYIKNSHHYCVMGNHEEMMIDALAHQGAMYDWSRNGGNETLISYDSPEDDEMLIEHKQWLSELPVYIEFPFMIRDHLNKKRSLVVSHSSIARYWPADVGNYQMQILWNRDYCDGTLPSSNDIYNVFGHSVVKEPVVKDFFANIDTGCVYNKSGFNKLTALAYPSLEVITQENIEDEDL